MKKNLKTACAKVTAVALALTMVVSAAPADAKAKKPALSASKATIKVGKTKKITVKKATPKKTTWTVNKKGKKIVKLTKKSKKSVTIKALKKGTATVTAKIKVGKKTYKKTVKVTVKKATGPTPTKNTQTSAAPSAEPSANTSAAPSAGTSAEPSANTSAAPSAGTSAEPSANTSASPSAGTSGEPSTAPSDEPSVFVPEGNEYKVEASEANLCDVVTSEYYSDLEFVTDGVVYTSNNQYNSCVAFYLADGKTVDVSDFDTLEIDLVCAYDQFDEENSVAKEAALKTWGTAATNFWGKADAAFEGADNVGTEADRVWTVPLRTLVGNGINLSDLKAIGAVVQNAEGEQTKVRSFTFKKNTDNFVSGDVPKAVSIKQADGLTKVEEGGTLDLVATVTNKNTATLDEAEVNWSSSNEAVATVADGTVTGVSAGKATITATVEGYDDITATYEVEVYNNDPAAIAIQVENNYKAYTVGELSEEQEGMAVTGVILNANGDVVGETASQNITVKDAGTTGAVIEDGVLTATAAGTMTLELEATDDFEAVTLEVTVIDGYRVPLTVENVYSASQESDDAKIENGVVSVGNITNYNAGIGFTMTLPDGVTVADIKGVSLYAATTASGVENVIPFAPYDAWTSKIAASAADSASWANGQTFGEKVAISADGATVVTFDSSKMTNSLETTSTTINFSIGFEYQHTDAISASDVILLKN